MSFFSDLFHPGRAYDKAQNKMDQYYSQANQYTQPYINRGNEAGTDLMSMLQKLMNPGALQDEWSKGYDESDFAKQREGEATNAGLDAASSLGLGGSSAALHNISQDTTNIKGQDRQQYMKDMMDKFLASIGIGQNLSGTGANAASNAANNTMREGENAYNSEYNSNAAGPNMWSGILSGLSGLAGSALGGPIGGALGGWLGNKLGGK
jgi:hypothetical protein